VDIREYDHDMMIMHMLHNGHGHGVALFGREINICNTVITPLRVKGGCEAMHATFSTSCDLSSYSVTANTIDWFIVVTCTHILYVHVQS
jgi:hypothetical protein